MMRRSFDLKKHLPRRAYWIQLYNLELFPLQGHFANHYAISQRSSYRILRELHLMNMRSRNQTADKVLIIIKIIYEQIELSHDNQDQKSGIFHQMIFSLKNMIN